MLKDLHPDILFNICAHLEISDAFAFVSVCRCFRKLANSKSLWISVLEEVSKSKSLACPLGTDLSQVDIDYLQKVARRTQKLESNWNREKPRLSRAVRSVHYRSGEDAIGIEVPGHILSVIPATSLVLLYEEHDRRIIVCDSKGKIPSCSVNVSELDEDRHVAYFDEPKCHYIAFNDTSRKLNILSVTHEGGKDPFIQELSTYPLDPNRDIVDLFLLTDVVGLVYRIEDNKYFLNITNFVQNVSTDVSMPFNTLASDHTIFAWTFENVPYLAISSEIGSDDVHEIYRCSLQNNVPGVDDDSQGGVAAGIKVDVKQIAQLDNPSYLNAESYSVTEEMGFSFGGVFLLRVVHETLHSNGTTYLFFWPIEDISSLGMGCTSTVATTHIEGEIIHSHFYSITGPRLLLAMSDSGMYIVAILQFDFSLQLCLLHLDIRHSSDGYRVRKLDVPSYVDLELIYDLAIEERYGVIYLSQQDGHLFALSYA